MDWYFNEAGDITLAPQGDVALTNTAWRDDAQQAYIRVMTEPGDYVLYPNLGAEMSLLYGMPQSEATANYGKQLIQAALERENRFAGKGIEITAAPTGPQTIRFDIYITSGARDILLMKIEQNLGLEPALVTETEGTFGDDLMGEGNFGG